MPFPPRWVTQACLTFWWVAASLAQDVFINEIHYDNSSSDVGEFVEIAGPAGTNLAGHTLVLYNGSGGLQYDSDNLTGTIPNERGGFGALAFFIAGIQNGAPDGVALFEGDQLIEFLSYEGTFMAEGAMSVDIGVSEGSGTPAGSSLQRSGEGSSGTDFVWVGPSDESPGFINTGQSFSAGSPAITLVIAPNSFGEDAGSSAATATLTLTPAPVAPLAVALSVDVGGEIVVPLSVAVGISGSATFDVGAVLDGMGDGDQVVEISAMANGYERDVESVTVFDVDPPPGRGATVRIATYNVQNGVGQPGDPSYEAALRVLRRVGPDVISFTEAKPDNDFANLKTLLAELGMPTGSDFIATKGDAFAAQSYEGGDFGSGQAIAVASRWPITRAVQIGRDVTSRRELTRFPLFVEIDVPGTFADPCLVAVHLKAGNTSVDIFRRAVEARRIREFIEVQGLTGSNDNLFVLGDINEDFEDFFPNSVFTGVNTMTHVFGDGSSFPASYLLGGDLSSPGITLDYTDFPKFAFDPVGVTLIDSEQADGAVRTYNVIGNARLDYVMAASSTIANASPQTEVYNSLLEYGHDGLPKLGPIPFGSDSYFGSDHHLVFGDFALEPVSQIVVSVTPGAIDEGDMTPITGSVEILPPAGEDTEVFLLDSAERFNLASSVMVPAGGEATFSATLRKPAAAAPDGALRITGYANDLVPGHDFIDVRSLQASGVLLFSGYVEPATGGAPKAVEIVNSSGVEIDFADTPMRLLQGRNGNPAPTEELTLRQGRLAAGEVMVVGGETAGDYLVGEGLLEDPGVDFSSFENGTPFLDAGGAVVFVYRPFFFNGDDSLMIQLSYTRADTFGIIGEDPGSAWSAGGVSSANQNLSLRSDVATGSSGWTDPRDRWDSNGSGNSLAGFGEPPALDDPYIVWARANGLFGAAAGLNEDLDCDGWSNLLDYALGGRLPEGLVVGSGGSQYLGVEFRRLVSAGRVDYAIEQSDGLALWSEVAVIAVGNPVPDGVGYERVVLRLNQPITSPLRRFLRVRATMP